MARSTTQLKTILSQRNAALVPGTANAMFARVIEELGFPAVYITGAGIARIVHATSRGHWILQKRALVDDAIDKGRYVRRTLTEIRADCRLGSTR